MHPRLVLSIGNFFSAGHFFLFVYVITPYLALYMPASQTGLVVSLGAIITLSVFPFVPSLVARFGAKRLVLMLGFLQAVTLLLLAFSPGLIPAIVGIALACAISPLIAYQLDLLLEATMRTEQETGRVRSLFLTAGNIALILTPLLIGFLLDGTDAYARVFLAAALALTPFITLFLMEKLPEGNPPSFHNLLATCGCIWKDIDLRAASLGFGVLQFFYHLAPLYIPLFLHTYLGIPWTELGWIFAVMLLPFVFVEYPAGWVADRWLGDKELMIAGFVITGVSFAMLGFITHTTPLLLIAALLFVTRIGAALVEAMVEGHFFRRVSERDATTIGIFRMSRPAAALLAPIVGSVILLTGNFAALFLISGALIVAFGIMASIAIHDIR